MSKGPKRKKVKARKNVRGAGKFGWTENGRLKVTFSKMEKAKSLEDEIIPLNNTKENVEAIIKLEVATGTKYK